MKLGVFFLLIGCLALTFLVLMGVIAINNPRMKYGGIEFYPNRIFEIFLYASASLTALGLSLLPVIIARKFKRAR